MIKALILITIISLLGCSKEKEIKEESFKLDFKKFQLNEEKGKIPKASFQYIPRDYMYEEKNTEMKEQYLKSEINFANFYITVSTLCGTGCIERFIVDTRTGYSYEFPRLDNWEGNGNIGVLCSKNNSLLVVQADGSWSKDMRTHSTGIWNWNEKDKIFESVSLDEISPLTSGY